MVWVRRDWSSIFNSFLIPLPEKALLAPASHVSSFVPTGIGKAQFPPNLGGKWSFIPIAVSSKQLCQIDTAQFLLLPLCHLPGKCLMQYFSTVVVLTIFNFNLWILLQWHVVNHLRFFIQGWAGYKLNMLLLFSMTYALVHPTLNLFALKIASGESLLSGSSRHQVLDISLLKSFILISITQELQDCFVIVVVFIHSCTNMWRISKNCWNSFSWVVMKILWKHSFSLFEYVHYWKFFLLYVYHTNLKRWLTNQVGGMWVMWSLKSFTNEKAYIDAFLINWLLLCLLKSCLGNFSYFCKKSWYFILASEPL